MLTASVSSLRLVTFLLHWPASLLMGDIAAVQYNKLMPCLYLANFLHICAIHTLNLHYIICVLCENELFLRLHPKATAFVS